MHSTPIGYVGQSNYMYEGMHRYDKDSKNRGKRFSINRSQRPEQTMFWESGQVRRFTAHSVSSHSRLATPESLQS